MQDSGLAGMDLFGTSKKKEKEDEERSSSSVAKEKVTREKNLAYAEAFGRHFGDEMTKEPNPSDTVVTTESVADLQSDLDIFTMDDGGFSEGSIESGGKDEGVPVQKHVDVIERADVFKSAKPFERSPEEESSKKPPEKFNSIFSTECRREELGDVEFDDNPSGVFDFTAAQYGLEQFADSVSDTVDEEDAWDFDADADEGALQFSKRQFTRKPEPEVGLELEQDFDPLGSDPFALKGRFSGWASKIVGAYNTISNMKSADFLDLVNDALDRNFDRKKNKKIDDLFEYGDLVKANDFEFLKHGNELMLYRYGGLETRVEIPAYVANLPVCYVHTDFLYRNAFSNYKTRGRDVMYREDNIAGASRGMKQSISNGIKEIIFPNTVKSIPGKCFIGCDRMTKIVIPESVMYLAPNAFDSSNVEDIYFNGKCPAGITLHGMRGRRIHVRKEYIHTFTELRR